MPQINATITFELEKPYIITRVSGETTRIVVHGSNWTENGDIFQIEIDGNLQECWNLNEVIGDFSLIAQE
ncbi:MAG: hypothetical protein PHF31_10395 [Methylobacter sp.]|nr:hypothetical protein [Methylobacter sp.]